MLEQDARPALTRAIFLEGDVKAMSHGQDDDLDGEEDEDAGEGITLRVADLVDALSDRLLQVGVKLEKVSGQMVRLTVALRCCGGVVRALDSRPPLPLLRALLYGISQ